MLTIAWDVDDVLNDLMRRWLIDEWLPSRPGLEVSFDDIITNPPENIIKCTLEEYLDSLDRFRLSGRYLEMDPDPMVLSWFERSGYKARHIALTAVPVRAAHISSHWVLKHFGKWIRSFHFVPSRRNNETGAYSFKGKAEYLKWLGNVDMLVEDNTANVREAEKEGIRGILLKKPWNAGGITVHDAMAELDLILGGAK